MFRLSVSKMFRLSVFCHSVQMTVYLWSSGTILTIENFDKNIRVQSDCDVRLLVDGWFPLTNTAGCVFEVHIKLALVCEWMQNNTAIHEYKS